MPPRRSFWRRFLTLCSRTLLALFLCSVALVLALRWIDPPFSAFMAEERIGAWIEGDDKYILRHDWVDWEDISPHAGIAVISSEDQKFAHHFGFDVDSIETAWLRHEQGRRLRGASTISQQVAKNLFLWNGRSWVRKGMEAYFTVLLELLWPKQRILEVYLNIVEFGPGIYGVGAASKHFFHAPAARLSSRQAALLAAVLPNPKRFRVERPSGYVLRRVQWIQRQMGQLGGSGYLRQL